MVIPFERNGLYAIWFHFRFGFVFFSRKHTATYIEPSTRPAFEVFLQTLFLETGKTTTPRAGCLFSCWLVDVDVSGRCGICSPTSPDYVFLTTRGGKWRTLLILLILDDMTDGQTDQFSARRKRGRSTPCPRCLVFFGRKNCQHGQAESGVDG